MTHSDGWSPRKGGHENLDPGLVSSLARTCQRVAGRRGTDAKCCQVERRILVDVLMFMLSESCARVEMGGAGRGRVLSTGVAT